MNFLWIQVPIFTKIDDFALKNQWNRNLCNFQSSNFHKNWSFGLLKISQIEFSAIFEVPIFTKVEILASQKCANLQILNWKLLTAILQKLVSFRFLKNVLELSLGHWWVTFQTPNHEILKILDNGVRFRVNFGCNR